jgi:hypothetical protein
MPICYRHQVQHYFSTNIWQLHNWSWDCCKTGSRLVLPGVPTRLVVVWGRYCLSSCQTGRVLATGLDTRHSKYPRPTLIWTHLQLFERRLNLATSEFHSSVSPVWQFNHKNILSTSSFGCQQQSRPHKREGSNKPLEIIKFYFQDTQFEQCG